MEGGTSSNTVQFSGMFQKFATAFKAKTYELFAEPSDVHSDGSSVLDSAEEFIPDQKVTHPNHSSVLLLRSLIPSLFAILSSFEAWYLQFQTAHVPDIDKNALEIADKSIVAILHKLTEIRGFYIKRMRGLVCDFEFPARSFLEFQVEENQNKLRALETMVNSLQSQIDVKDDEVRVLKKNLDKSRIFCSDLLRKFKLKEEKMCSQTDVLLTVSVFERMLSDSMKLMHRFTKLLMDLMGKAGWDLEKVANSVYSGVVYSKTRHFRYVFLSYVSLAMYQNFDKNDFGLYDSGLGCNGNGFKHNENGVIDGEDNCSLKQLVEHVSSNPMEILVKNPKCDFSRFCEKKYEELIHPNMESSIFINLDGKEKVLDSWKSLSVFYESFASMASSIWVLHKLAYSFTPAVEIFWVERGIEFSIVYMEDVVGKCNLVGKTRPRVMFTVVPGFKVGRTVIQSQVYSTV